MRRKFNNQQLPNIWSIFNMHQLELICLNWEQIVQLMANTFYNIIMIVFSVMYNISIKKGCLQNGIRHQINKFLGSIFYNRGQQIISSYTITFHAGFQLFTMSQFSRKLKENEGSDHDKLFFLFFCIYLLDHLSC